MSDNVAAPIADQEVATTGEGRDITRLFTGELLLPYDKILSGKGGGDLAVYEAVMSDPQVRSVFEQRRKAVVQAPWQVEAGGKRPIDKEAAEFVEAQLRATGWDRVTDLMLYGVFYGYSVAELLWEVQGNRLGWRAIKVRNRRRFRFGKNQELRLLTKQNFYPGEDAKPPQFWHFATGADNDDEPYGMGLAHWLYWPVLFKRNGLKFWLTFLEKFGTPTAVGKYDTGATAEERKKLLQATRALQQDAGLILPKNMELALLEATRGGTADYQAMHDTMDETIAKVVVGQTMTSQDGSSEAQANVHMDVRQDIVKADSDLVCESFSLGPVRWLVEFNFPGAAMPRVYRMLEAEEDLDKTADTDSKVAKLGFKPSLSYIKETYGEHWEVSSGSATSIGLDGKPVVDARAQDTDADATDFAASDDPTAVVRARNVADQDAIADAAKALADAAWRELAEPRVAQLLTLLDETGDLSLFRERLVELADSDPSPAFVQALQRAGFGAQLLARVPKN